MGIVVLMVFSEKLAMATKSRFFVSVLEMRALMNPMLG